MGLLKRLAVEAFDELILESGCLLLVTCRRIAVCDLPELNGAELFHGKRQFKIQGLCRPGHGLERDGCILPVEDSADRISSGFGSLGEGAYAQTIRGHLLPDGTGKGLLKL